MCKTGANAREKLNKFSVPAKSKIIFKRKIFLFLPYFLIIIIIISLGIPLKSPLTKPISFHPISGMTLSSEVAVSQPAKPPPPRPSAPPSRPSAPPMVPPPRPAPPPPRPADPPQPAKTVAAAVEVPAKVKPAGFSDLFCAPPDPDIGTDIPISLSSGSLVTASGGNAGLSLCLLYGEASYLRYSRKSLMKISS
jgi:hypothetical protein